MNRSRHLINAFFDAVMLPMAARDFRGLHEKPHALTGNDKTADGVESATAQSTSPTIPRPVETGRARGAPTPVRK